MTRIVRTLGVIAALLLLPFTSQAVEITVIPSKAMGDGDPTVLLPGETVTFSMIISNASGEFLNALGVGVSGHDINQNGIADDGLTFNGFTDQTSVLPEVPGLGIDNPTGFGTGSNAVAEAIIASGTAGVADYLWTVDDGSGNPIPNSGLFNVRGGTETPSFTTIPGAVAGTPFDLRDYRAAIGMGAYEFGFNSPINILLGLPTVQERWVSVFDAVSIGGTSTTAPQDFSQTIGGPVHAAVQFTATPTSAAQVHHTLNFGEQAQFGATAVGAGGAPVSYTSTSFSFTVVPEPGTALLMGLGLAGLAGVRRR